MRVYNDRSLWFDTNKEHVCIIDGVVSSVIPDMAYRVTYIGESYGVSVSTDYVYNYFTDLRHLLNIGDNWFNSHQTVCITNIVSGSKVGLRFEYGFECDVELLYLINNFSPVIETYFTVGDCYTHTHSDDGRLLKLIDIGNKYLILNCNEYTNNFTLPISDGKSQLTKVDLSTMIAVNDLMVNDNGDYITIKYYDSATNTVDVIHHSDGKTTESKYTCYHILSRYKKSDKRLFLESGELWVNDKNQYWVDDIYKDNKTSEILYIHCKPISDPSKTVILSVDDFFSNYKKININDIIKPDNLFYERGKKSEGCIIKKHSVIISNNNKMSYNIIINIFNWNLSDEVPPELYLIEDLYSFFEKYELHSFMVR